MRFKSLRWIGLFSLMVVVGCAKTETVEQPAPSVPSPQAVVPVEPNVVAELPQPTSNPADATPMPTVTVPAQPLPVPQLIPPTTSVERLPQVSIGRSDPFAAIATNPLVMPAPASRPTSSPAPLLQSQPTTQPQSTQPLPLVPLPQLPAANSSNPPSLPSVAVQPAPVVATQPTSPRIIVSGVVQLSDRVAAIVEVPGEGTSRYVGPGEYIDNGRVLVRQIDVSNAQEPRVILVQDGVEMVRTVGSGSFVGAL